MNQSIGFDDRTLGTSELSTVMLVESIQRMELKAQAWETDTENALGGHLSQG